MENKTLEQRVEQLEKLVEVLVRKDISRIHIYPTNICPKCGEVMQEINRVGSAIQYQCVNSLCEHFREVVIRYLADSATLGSVYPALVSHTEPRIQLMKQ